MPVAFQLDGLKETLAKFNSLPADTQQWVDDELTATAYTMADTAKQLAPVDLGALKNSIDVTRNEPLLKQVSAQVEYAAYVEFGTGTRVTMWPFPEDLAAYAIQFKGAGIRKVNLYAQPYFFPAYQTATEELVKRLKVIIETNAGK